MQYNVAGNIQKIGGHIYHYDRFGRLAEIQRAPPTPGTTIPVNEQN